MLETLLIILGIVVIAIVARLARQLYYRSVRIMNRAQMSVVYTDITHELLTPLTVISASVERLRQQAPDHQGDYDLMQLNIDRMVRLLQQILETSKSQSGELKLRVAHGDVMQYIQRTALCIEPLMSKRHLDFTIHCQPESMMGWIDTDKLDKIIYNLLSNAAKYTNENGRVQLMVQTNKTYDHIIIRVQDNGIGIPQDKMKHLFQRFFDGDYRRSQTIGTGLGLALTRELVYLHGGNITCDSEEGHGTTFTVTLPISKESFAPAQLDEHQKMDVNATRSAILDLATRMHGNEAQQPAQDATAQLDDDAYRLLIVEDNVELLMLMSQLLSQKYHVKTASNGQQALDIVNSAELDLIVSDVMMPVMDGHELTRRVKGDPNTSHLPIILLTAKTQDGDRTEALQIGADDFIAKPFRLSDLELRINNIVENRKRIQHEFRQQTAEETQQRVEQATLQAEPTADQLFLKRALDCVYQHLDDGDYDRDAFAADMGASASTLYNKLRSLTGMSVSSFIRDIRMKEAQRIARQQPDIRVSDLAYRVGFHDPKYFSTCFKKQFGLQPTEYLESLAKAQET